MRRAVAIALLTLSSSVPLAAQEEPAARQWDFEPRIDLAAVYSDNVNLAPPGEEEDELVMQLAPHISLKRDSERLKVDLEYGFEQLAYQQESGRDESFQQGDVILQSELLRDHFFVDLSGSLTQQVADPDQAFPPSNIPLSANRIDALDADIAPYWRQTLGGLGDLELKYERSIVRYGDPPEDEPDLSLQDVDRQQAFVALTSPARRQGTTWGFNYNYDRQDFPDFSEVEFEEASLQLGYKVTAAVQIFGTGGLESDYREHRSTADLDNAFWEAGVAYVTPERDDLRFAMGHRTFGTSVNFDWLHKFQGITAIVRYFEDPSTNAGARFDSGESLQIPGNVLDRPNDVSVFLRRRFEGGLAWDRGRSVYNLAAYAEERSDRVNDPDAITDFGEERIKGTNGSWQWQAGVHTDLTFGLGWERSELTDGRDFDISHGSVEAHYALGEHTGLRLKVEQSTRGGDPERVAAEGISNYDESRVSLYIERTFF